MIQVIQINRTNNKGNKKRKQKEGVEKKGGNTMNRFPFHECIKRNFGSHFYQHLDTT